MLQAKIQQANRCRAIQAANRQNRARNRDWLRGDPIPVVDASDEILEEKPEDIVIANEPDEVEEPEVAQGFEEPEDIMADAAIGNDDDFVLNFLSGRRRSRNSMVCHGSPAVTSVYWRPPKRNRQT